MVINTRYFVLLLIQIVQRCNQYITFDKTETEKLHTVTDLNGCKRLGTIMALRSTVPQHSSIIRNSSVHRFLQCKIVI